MGKPVRMCCACRSRKEKESMLRIAKKPGGHFVIDLSQKEEGRGAYVCRDVSCIQTAEKRHSLERSFRCKIPGDLYEKMKEEIG